MFKRFKNRVRNCVSIARGIRKDENGVVMVEWVALAGVFVAILIATFLTIGNKANVVVGEVDSQLGTITSQIDTGG